MLGPYLYGLFLAWQAAFGPWWAVPICWGAWELMLWIWKRDLEYQAAHK